MITTIQQRERREGAKMVQVKVPAVPKSHDELIRPIEQAITSRTKLMVVSHVSFMNGQIFPIERIVKLARAHNIPVVVDGAHAFVQFAFDNKDLECDMFGTSLHKWLMAPVGTGMLYVRKNRIKDVWPLMAAGPTQDDNIRKFEEIGTHPAANHNAIAEAINFHETIGIHRKEARLRYLRHRWTDRLRDDPKFRFYTNLDPAHSCAITTVGIQGIKTGDLGTWLLDKHSIFVVGIVNDFIDGLRITPNVYSTVEEIDRLADALLYASKNGLTA
jgi:selenocysteine lyase/cysteine desulfurase